MTLEHAVADLQHARETYRGVCRTGTVSVLSPPSVSVSVILGMLTTTALICTDTERVHARGKATPRLDGARGTVPLLLLQRAAKGRVRSSKTRRRSHIHYNQ